MTATDRTPDLRVPSTPAPAAAPWTHGRIRALGCALAVSAPVWAATVVVFGDVTDFGWRTLLAGITALAFQASIVALLRLEESSGAMSRPGASGRVAVVGHRVQYALMAGAVMSTLLDMFELLQGTVVWAVFDACWPLSMLGMVIIGVRIAVVGRWHGALRWHTLFAHSWLLWGIPLMAFGTAGQLGMVAQVVLGYGLLGVRIAARPADTRDH